MRNAYAVSKLFWDSNENYSSSIFKVLVFLKISLRNLLITDLNISFTLPNTCVNNASRITCVHDNIISSNKNVRKNNFSILTRKVTTNKYFIVNLTTTQQCATSQNKFQILIENSIGLTE